jgi:hypothetical protein
VIPQQATMDEPHEATVTTLWRTYGDDSCSNAETGLLETLSAVASMKQAPRMPPDAIWAFLHHTAHVSDQDEFDDDWSRGLTLIGRLVQRLSPFDIHLCATQALAFSSFEEDEIGTEAQNGPLICLLLCAQALEECPSEIKRWKRWQSTLCESIRFFQQYRQPDWELQLWFDYLLNQCQNVRLPADACHIGIAAGLVGTCLELFAEHPDQVSRYKGSLSAILPYKEILGHPWKVAAASLGDKPFVDRSNLAWWTEFANQDEAVASMDTTWNPKGVAILALECWKNDNVDGLSHVEKWALFFPHVSTLLLEQDTSQLGMELVKELLIMMPSRTLQEWGNDPASPIKVLQLLSNLLIASSLRQDQASAMAVSHVMQDLIQKYSLRSQMGIVQQLLQECRYPGLEPRLLDLLRHVAREHDCDELWSFLQARYLHKMLQHVDANEELQELEDLLDNLETYVAATSMVRVHLMVHHCLPITIMDDKRAFEALLKGVQRTAQNWERNTNKPKDYHRLFLLQSTLAAVVDLLETIDETS